MVFGYIHTPAAQCQIAGLIASQLVKKLMQMVRLPFHNFAVRAADELEDESQWIHQLSEIKTDVDSGLQRYTHDWLPARLRKKTFPKQVTIQEQK